MSEACSQWSDLIGWLVLVSVRIYLSWFVLVAVQQYIGTRVLNNDRVGIKGSAQNAVRVAGAGEGFALFAHSSRPYLRNWQFKNNRGSFFQNLNCFTC